MPMRHRTVRYPLQPLPARLGFSVLRPPAHLLGSDETHHVFFLRGVLICWNRGLSTSPGAASSQSNQGSEFRKVRTGRMLGPGRG